MARGSTVLPVEKRSLRATLGRSLLLWERPWSAAFLAGMIYLGITLTAGSPLRVSTFPYYNYLADAFLHGQLALRVIPPHTLDLSLLDGKYYLYWGPFPAALLMPFVALFGLGFSDILQSLVLGAVDIGLFALLLRQAGQRGIIDLSAGQRAGLVLFFALGTALTPLPPVGQVWQISNLVAVGLTLLAYLAAMNLSECKACVLVGAAAGAVLLTRPTAVFAFGFLAWILLERAWKERGWRGLWVVALAAGLPLLAAVVVLGMYNSLRFGSPLDMGLAYHQMSPSFLPNFQKYGAANLYYLPINAYYLFIAYPFAVGRGWVDGQGGSLFLLSPLFFAALYALWQDRRKPGVWAMLGSILLGMIPSLLVMAPGTYQFGSRYSLDYVVPLLLLTALGMKRWPGWLVGLLVSIAVLHFLVGSLMFTYALATRVY